MIVQALQEIQEELGWVPPHKMRELSERLKVPLHRIHEVASFYPLYKLEEPPKVEVKVCRDMACHIHGAPRLQQSLEAYCNTTAPGQIHVDGVSCLGQCDHAVAISINDHYYYRGMSEKEYREKIKQAYDNPRALEHQKADSSPKGWKIDCYNAQPKYEFIKKFISGELTDEEILKQLEEANLRGMGGAGFPTARKWRTVRDVPGDTKYVVCNADESEPGTFKDRELMRITPHLLVEGITLAGLVSGAKQGWVYIRHEYPEEEHAMEQAIKEAREQNLVGENILGSGKSFDLQMFVSPGGYVQGEESSLLEAMEDKRGEPRNKPPFPVFEGLWGKPTIINNVETLSWVPAILHHGGKWYHEGGTNGAPGIRFVSISGDINKPGVYEVPFGMTVRELVMDLAGGMREGQKLQAIAPSGPSGGFLPAVIKAENVPEQFRNEKMKGAPTMDILDLTLDLDTLRIMGGMLGAAFVVYGDKANMVDNAHNCTSFFRNESCGKCVPCRMGSEKMTEILEQVLDRKYGRHQLQLVHELADTMIQTSICGLGQVAPNPMAFLMRHFSEELDQYLTNGTEQN